MQIADTENAKSQVKTGIPGLDEVLYGGFPAHALYLVEGSPGTGKTTTALQFLLEGKRLGERVLYVTLSETEEEIREVARSHGWSLDGIDVLELEAAELRLKPEQEYTVFYAEEVELTETMKHVYAEVERINPTRVVFDSLSEMRLVARDPLRFRRQILSIKHFFRGRGCTVLLLDDKTEPNMDLQLQSMGHGVLSLERMTPPYGGFQRRLEVVKLRGAPFREGYHDYILSTGGLRVFPRLIAAEHRGSHDGAVLSSGIAELDRLLGGGLNRGTSTLIMGPAGTGKSTLAASYLRAIAAHGKRGIAYLFEETRQTFMDRMAGMSMDMQEPVDAGLVQVRQIDPVELSPGEFVAQARNDVENRKTEVVVLDSLNGYLNSGREGRVLLLQTQELLKYLAEKGVLTILIVAQQGPMGAMQSSLDVSYIADTLIVLRYFENNGAVKKAVSVVKHRKGNHEKTIRELQLTPEGVRIGEVLQQFHGVLTGFPEYRGAREDLLDQTQ
jgi:circadian clock protein KaiC